MAERARILAWSEAAPGAALGESLEVLRAGGVVAHPTETVYGLAAAAEDERGQAELLRLKGRSPPRAFLLLFASRGDLEARLGELPTGGDALARAFWPGPLTLLFPARADLPTWWSGPDGDVAARVTPHPFAVGLVQELGGPVLSTSANPPGRATPATAAGVARAFAGCALRLVVDGGPRSGSPSTLLRWTDRGWAVLRSGPVERSAIERVVPPAAAGAPSARGFPT
ncbi:MAG: L-threonylcarbamoyladenylate synthase [Gemmatimonadota bacterium]